MLDAGHAPGTRRHSRLADRGVFVVVGVMAAALHALSAGLGLRIRASDLRAAVLAHRDVQLLPYGLLHGGLLGSVARLHSQPPAFNLATGVLVQLPRVMQPSVASGAMAACAVAVAVATTGLLLELGVSRGVTAAVVVLFVLADPAQYLYGATYSAALPTAAVATAAGWAAVRWARTNRVAPGLAYGACAAGLILTSSAFQLYTVALATVPVVWVLRHRWRRVAAVLIGPLLVVGAWYANDVIEFHVATTSSWLGMDLAGTTLALDTTSDLHTLVGEGVVSRTDLVAPFSALKAYGELGTHVPTGLAALDLRGSLGAPNFDNVAYLAISRQYLADDLHWIEHRPLLYARHATVGLRMWLLPSDQSPATTVLGGYHLGGYTTVYDAAVLLQPAADPAAAATVLGAKRGPGLTNLSITVVLESLLALGVLPVVAWRRRRRDPGGAAGALWIWVCCASVFGSSTLLVASANNLVRFELGGLPLCAATVAVVWAADRSSLRRGLLDRGTGRERDRGAGEALAVDDEPPRVATRWRELEGAQVDGHGDVNR